MKCLDITCSAAGGYDRQQSSTSELLAPGFGKAYYESVRGFNRFVHAQYPPHLGQLATTTQKAQNNNKN